MEKTYAITLNEEEVAQVLRALKAREYKFNIKASDKGNDMESVDRRVALDYRNLAAKIKTETGVHI